MQFRVNPVGAGILTVYLRRPDSPNSLLFARSRASHAEPLDLVISDMSAVELKPAVIFRLSGSEKNESQGAASSHKRGNRNPHPADAFAFWRRYSA
jgi:hypothetical protein